MLTNQSIWDTIATQQNPWTYMDNIICKYNKRHQSLSSDDEPSLIVNTLLIYKIGAVHSKVSDCEKLVKRKYNDLLILWFMFARRPQLRSPAYRQESPLDHVISEQ